jgi:hypothetical protein
VCPRSVVSIGGGAWEVGGVVVERRGCGWKVFFLGSEGRGALEMENS